MKYDINRPWMTLDKWQKDYIYKTKPNDDCFLLCGRQAGKTTAMSIKAVELCLKHFKKGEFVLINSITEKQAKHMLMKSLVYAKERHFGEVVWKGKNKPTYHQLMFKNGTGILCYAAGETGEGQRGFTIKKLMVDEGSRMSEDYYVASMPMLSVIKGSMDIASTPAGKKHKDGSEKFFYRCSKDPKFKNFYVSGEDCPRHSEDFLETQKERLSKLAYAQEYLAVFTDELRRMFSDALIEKTCTLQRPIHTSKQGGYYLGVDVAGFGEDECSYEILRSTDSGMIQVENITENRNLTTDTTRKILELDKKYEFERIGIDDGGIGFGVWSELRNSDAKNKVVPLNNASRETGRRGEKSKRILKEEMYIELQVRMEKNKIKLLDDDEVMASLASIQVDDGKIFGSNSHIVEGIIRALWLGKDKSLNISIRTIKV